MKAKIVLVLPLIFILVSISFGQTLHTFKRPTGSLADATKGAFSSTEGGFSIGLPRQIGGFNGTKGIQYSWRLNEGYYFVGIEDRDRTVEGTDIFEAETDKVIDSLFNEIARDLFETKYEVKSVERKIIEFNGHKAKEVRATLTDTVAVIRLFWIGSRAYKTAVLLTKTQLEFEPQSRTVFDSLQIVSNETTNLMIQKRIAENTPKPLPQGPTIAKAKSDVEDEGLRGKVKTILQESQFVKGTKAGSPKQKDFEASYNDQGNLIKRISYDDTSGFPFQITVYGYVGRNRVSKSGHIEYGNEIGGIAMVESSGKSRRQNNRYDYRYSYKYDAAKNLVEKTTFDNSGGVWTRVVFMRRANSVEQLIYDEDGKLNSRSLSKLDENGHETESTDFDSPMEGWNAVYTYRYDEFDKEGNWTKRTMTKSRSFEGTTKEEWVMVESRSIVYF